MFPVLLDVCITFSQKYTPLFDKRSKLKYFFVVIVVVLLKETQNIETPMWKKISMYMSYENILCCVLVKNKIFCEVCF